MYAQCPDHRITLHLIILTVFRKFCSEWLSMTEYMTLFIVEVNGAAYKTESEK